MDAINSGISFTGHVPLTVPGYLHHHLCSAVIWSCSDVKSACLDPRLGGGHPKEGSNISHTCGILFTVPSKFLIKNHENAGARPSGLGIPP